MPEREQKRDPSFILRSNSISVVVTILALGGTVAAVYGLFPRRDNELMTQSAIEHRRTEVTYDLETPTEPEIRAWSAGALGSGIPWVMPQEGIEVLGARSLQIQKRRTALVRYRLGGVEVTIVAQRGRDTPPRKHRRVDGDDLVASWRDGKWTFVAVGPKATSDKWLAIIGAK